MGTACRRRKNLGDSIGVVLQFNDPLPRRPERVLIAGVSGVGKTSLAKRVSDVLGIQHTELDALFHGEAWVPREGFLADVHALAAAEAWITEWQYAAARPILAARADLVLWLDLPFFTVTLPRVVRRTIRRRARREVLWNGNTEPPLRTFLTDPEHIVRWAWTTRNKYRAEVPEFGSSRPQLTVVRLQSQRKVESWLAGPLADATR
jgi:adenylate kinase family enzyme